MSFSKIIGQQDAVKIMQDALKSGRINHAYLFAGKEGTGKKSLAYEFARAIFCQESRSDSCDQCLSCRKIEHGNHPDLKYINTDEESKVIKIEQIRELQMDLAFKPYESSHKVYIIDNAAAMTLQAANSLLKTLEEPPTYAVIILLATEIEHLLPTVVSRCQLVKLSLIPRELIRKYLKREGIKEEQTRLFSMLAAGSLGRALQLAQDENFFNFRKNILDFLMNLPDTGTVEIFKQVDEMVKALDENYPLFDLLSSWYHDIIMREKGNKEEIVNYDYLRGIEKQQGYSLPELIAIIELINEYYNYIKSNVKTDLALQVLFLKIRAKRV